MIIKKDTIECQVCITKTKRHVPCDCHFEMCNNCCKTYILSKNQPAHCMSCNKLWSREFLFKHFSKYFINTEYKKHRESFLLEQELILLPATQEDAECERKMRILLANRKKLLEPYQNKYPTDINEWRTVYSQVREINREMYKLKSKSKSKPKATTFRKCPHEGCRGFINVSESNSKITCGICENSFCKSCNEPYGASNHECDPQIKSSVQSILKDTTPCPQCGLRVYRNGGCSQVWCISCNIAFDFITGKKETGMIHNPVGLEWIQKNGLGDALPPEQDPNCAPEWVIEFQREQNLMHFEYRMRDVFDTCYEQRKLLRNIYRTFVHILMVEVRGNYGKWTPRHHNDNKDLRVSYILNDFDMNKFSHLIQIREKKREKSHSIYQVLETTSTIGFDIWDVLATTDNPNNFNSKFHELFDYIKYHNEVLMNISKMYNCVCPFILKNGLLSICKHVNFQDS